MVSQAGEDIKRSGDDDIIDGQKQYPLHCNQYQINEVFKDKVTAMTDKMTAIDVVVVVVEYCRRYDRMQHCQRVIPIGPHQSSSSLSLL